MQYSPVYAREYCTFKYSIFLLFSFSLLICVVIYLFSFTLFVCFPELQSCEDPLKVKREILNGSYGLCKDFQPQDVKIIPFHMKSSSSLSRDDVERIQHLPATTDKAELLLDILHTKPNEAYFRLLVCLYNIRRDLYSKVRTIQKQEVHGKIKIFRLILANLGPKPICALSEHHFAHLACHMLLCFLILSYQSYGYVFGFCPGAYLGAHVVILLIIFWHKTFCFLFE